ncbi:MAG: DNA gyrase inhibitor YacG [Alphaproteobacteria bacterium]|nr:DNA gyrase inhibitor YacG [Alphaproteobacteria bacterium]
MPCPICKKEADPAYAPFCSKRCADVDLNRWLGGVYVMHTNEAPPEGEPEPAPPEKPG